MIFLTTADLDALLRTELRTLIADEVQLDTIEAEAISEMSTYIRGRYDAAALFALRAPEPPREGEEPQPQPDPRPRVIVMYLTDLVIYHLYAALNPRQLPDLRRDRYDQAIRWLERVSNGKLAPDLPAYASEENISVQNRFGSNRRSSNYW